VRGRAKDIRLWIADAIAKDRSRARDVTNRLLAGVDPDERQAIVAKSRRQTLHPSQVLFRTGERAEQLFVLRKGRVQFGRLSSAGREVVMGILGPGDVLGLACLLPSSNYIGTAEALDGGEVQVWSRHVIRRLAHRYPQVQGNVLQIALTYVAEFADRLEKLVSGTAEHRLARALTSLGVRIGTPSHSSIDILIKNEQLASLADVSPFTVSRLLKQWEREGVISKSRGIVRILSPEDLLVE
jgi:CRP/FNR family transcriptional regulator, nitrogen oxide reductase regulator